MVMGKEDIDLCGALHSVFLIVGNDSLWDHLQKSEANETSSGLLVWLGHCGPPLTEVTPP